MVIFYVICGRKTTLLVFNVEKYTSALCMKNYRKISNLPVMAIYYFVRVENKQQYMDVF